jgi:hypothetical protein
MKFQFNTDEALCLGAAGLGGLGSSMLLKGNDMHSWHGCPGGLPGSNGQNFTGVAALASAAALAATSMSKDMSHVSLAFPGVCAGCTRCLPARAHTVPSRTASSRALHPAAPPPSHPPAHLVLPTAARLQETKKNVLTGAGLANLGCAVFTATEAGNRTVDKKAGTIAALSSVSTAPPAPHPRRYAC